MAQAKRDSITRRALLSGAAAAASAAVIPAAAVASPNAALTAAPTIPDPIFAAIDAHTKAFAEFNAVLDDLAVAERTAWHAPRGQRRAANRRLAEARAAEGRCSDLASDAFDEFVATVPQTLEGALAALRYVRERCSRGITTCEEDECDAFLASLEGCLVRVLRGAAA
jgi:hypothetical protein